MKSTRWIAVAAVLSTWITACSSKNPSSETGKQQADGARSGVFVTDQLTTTMTSPSVVRKSALLGIFVSEYLSFSSEMLSSRGGLLGVSVQDILMGKQSTVSDPDYELLQAFADALQVDVADLLNRSTDRQQALDAYLTALENVGKRANQRYEELSSLLEQLKTELRAQGKVQSDAQRALKKAIADKQFTEASDLQKALTKAQEEYAETDLKRKQTEDIVSTLDSLLTLFGEKLVAIQGNREILIAGNRIVDVPGIEELKIIERKSRTSTSRRKGGAFNSLFEGL
jgi:transcriptional regulator with XRE-family HTH domain